MRLLSTTLLSAAALLVAASPALAQDVHVNGYYRQDGTYVQPHVRSAPDGIQSNNYGPSTTDSQRMNPRQRDYNQDGVPNYRDSDDDGDGQGDNWDSNPYGR